MHARAHLAARVVPQVAPVDLEAAVVVRVHELVHDRVLHRAPRREAPRAEEDAPRRGVEPAKDRALRGGAGPARDVRGRDRAACELQVFAHEYDRRAWFVVCERVWRRVRGETAD